MRSLGLQQRHKTSEARSVAEFLANNIVTTAGIESNIFNSVNGEESCFQSHASRRSVCELGTEKSYQSLSEETSDSSEKRTNSDGLSRKTRRSSLSKEDLDRLREKERLAKRRQRAKNKKVRRFFLEFRPSTFLRCLSLHVIRSRPLPLS